MGVSTLSGLGQVAVPLIRPLLRTSVWMVFGDRELAGARCSFQGLPINLSFLVQLGHEAKSEAPFGPSRLVPMMTMCLVEVHPSLELLAARLFHRVHCWRFRGTGAGGCVGWLVHCCGSGSIPQDLLCCQFP